MIVSAVCNSIRTASRLISIVCFDCYDSDKSGYIDRAELERMISMIYQLFYNQIPHGSTSSLHVLY